MNLIVIFKIFRSQIVICFFIIFLSYTVLIGQISKSRKAIDLSSEKVVDKLSGIPVFGIRDERNFLQREIFLSRKDANNYARYLNLNPELSDKVKVFPISLGGLYKFKKDKQNPKNKINFIYIPTQESIDLTKTILKNKGQKYRNDIPLFVIRNSHNKTYLSFQDKSEIQTPLFFEKEQVERVLSKIKEQEQDIAEDIYIEVIFLDDLIKMLETEDNEFSERFTLIPSNEAQVFIDKTKIHDSQGSAI